MSSLRIFADRNPGRALYGFNDSAAISRELARIGVLFERWEAAQRLDADAPQDEIIEAYREPIDRLMMAYGFCCLDVVAFRTDLARKPTRDDHALHEHTHDDFEVRFFVAGDGLYYLHTVGQVYALHCTRGDLIAVPGGMAHWFDMGPQPYLDLIRISITPENPTAYFTGDAIAARFPRLDCLDLAV